MQIKPFETIRGFYDKDTIKSIRSDVHYTPKPESYAKAGPDKFYTNMLGRLVLSKKYLIKFEDLGTVFIKILYIYYHNNMSEIHDINELKENKDTELKLSNIITSLYTDDYRKYYGNVIYTFTGSGQIVNTVFENKQKFDKSDYTPEETLNNYNECLFAFIVSENPFKIQIDVGKNQTFFSNGNTFTNAFQLVHEEMFKEKTTVGELLDNNIVNLEFNSYKSTIYKDMNTFNDTNLLNMSQGYTTAAIEGEKYLDSPASHVFAARDNKLGDMMVYSECLKSMMLEIFKAYKFTMIDRIDFSYYNKKLFLNKITSPFDKVHRTLILNAATQICNRFEKSISEISSIFENCNILVTINDNYIFVRFEDKDTKEKIDKMSFMDDLICDFMYYNLKSKRYKKNHPSNIMKDNMRMSTMMHYFDEEYLKHDIPF